MTTATFAPRATIQAALTELNVGDMYSLADIADCTGLTVRDIAPLVVRADWLPSHGPLGFYRLM